jgi:exopolyphosphatase/guanosine-5'-triphosphate,3'-diphosphate pyrophosphatase
LARAADIIGSVPTISAAVDVGSTSVHLLVARAGDRVLEPVVDESMFLGLGARIDAAGHLGADARMQLARTLAACAAQARELGATSIVFVGTEPLRRAVDAGRAIREVEAASGVPLHVLTHEEEAFLTLIGVTSGRPVTAPIAVIDVGGGSTEIVMARPGEAVRAAGVRVGAGRLAGEIVHGDPPGLDEIAALRTEAHRRVAALAGSVSGEVVAVGGTASNLRKLVAPGTGANITRDLLRLAFDSLVSGRAEDIARLRGIREARVRILPAGAAILEAIMDRAGVDEIRVSLVGIREGAILVTAHDPAGWRDRLQAHARGWNDSGLVG